MEYIPKDIINPFMEELLPPYKNIPEEFTRHTYNNKWCKLFNDWFFNRLTKLELIPKEGIDQDKALHHIRTAMQGWDSKHEHKEAGVAYLMSLWFEDAKWEVETEVR